MSARGTVPKTYKLFVGGAFVRSESGRSLPVEDRRGRTWGHLCRASRKDLRDAVVAAQGAGAKWAGVDAYLRGQVLYRMAEMLEGAADGFASTLAATVPGGQRRARREVDAAIDRLVCYAGWADKFDQVLGCRNPVAGPFHVFSLPEPTGVCGVLAPDEEPLLALISLLAPPLAAGCTVVALGSSAHPAATAQLGEVCATSDLPAGTLNLLTGSRDELLEEFAAHRGIDALHAAGCKRSERAALEAGAANNLKRVAVRQLGADDWYDAELCGSPWWIERFVETKTLWHPSAT